MVFPPVYAQFPPQTSSDPITYSLLQQARMETQDDLRILFINGTYYEMGYQQGYFLAEDIKQNLRAFIDYAGISQDRLLEMWEIMQPYVPDEYIEEIQGIADGAELSFDEVIAGYMVITYEDMGCFGFAAWENATADGHLLHARSFDQPLEIIDPVTGEYANSNALIVVRQPDDGFASLSPTIAGIPHSGGGFNEKGIALGQQVCWSQDQTLHGTPALFRTQMVLDHAAHITDALDFLITNSTLGWNYIVSDAKKPVGYALELSANHTYIGCYNNPVESQYPFWEIPAVVRRTNFFLDPVLADTQRSRLHPGGLRGLLRLITFSEIYFAPWRSYKAVSTDLNDAGGTLTLSSSMDLLRNSYAGNSDALLKLIVILAQKTSFNRAWNMWVADPLTGDLLVCFANNQTIAFENPVHYLNFYDLLE